MKASFLSLGSSLKPLDQLGRLKSLIRPPLATMSNDLFLVEVKQSLFSPYIYGPFCIKAVKLKLLLR